MTTGVKLCGIDHEHGLSPQWDLYPDSLIPLSKGHTARVKGMNPSLGYL